MGMQIPWESQLVLSLKSYGDALIRIYQYIKRNKKFGLTSEACNDYLPEGEYTCYWYVGGKSILA